MGAWKGLVHLLFPGIAGARSGELQTPQVIQGSLHRVPGIRFPPGPSLPCKPVYFSMHKGSVMLCQGTEMLLKAHGCLEVPDLQGGGLEDPLCDHRTQKSDSWLNQPGCCCPRPWTIYTHILHTVGPERCPPVAQKSPS